MQCSGCPAARYDVIFDVARAAIAELAAVATVAVETSSWPYRHDSTSRGFIDGTENPTLIDVPGLVLLPQGWPGAGGTILLRQKWVHDSADWEALPVHGQEAVIGRTKLDSVELEPKPEDSHVASTDQELTRYTRALRGAYYFRALDRGLAAGVRLIRWSAARSRPRAPSSRASA